MEREKLTVTLLLEEDRWTKPRMGTEKQHKSLCNKAKIFRYQSVQSFLDAWPAYRDKRMRIGADGSLDKVQAHWFFLHLRRVERGLRRKIIPK